MRPQISSAGEILMAMEPVLRKWSRSRQPIEGEQTIESVFAIGHWIVPVPAKTARISPKIFHEMEARGAVNVLEAVENRQGLQGGGGSKQIRGGDVGMGGEAAVRMLSFQQPLGDLRR